MRSLLLGGLACALLLGVASPVSAQVIISEVMAINDTVLQDEDLDYSDWIELYNSGGSSVDLTGWHLTDSKSDLTKWTFPATNIPAGGFLLVYASDKDRTTPNLHANFKLSDSGEYVALVHPDGTNVEHELRGVPDQFPDISYGIQTHGTNPTLRAGEHGFLIERTPGTANTCLTAPHPLYSGDSVARVDLSISQTDWDWLMNSPWDDSYRSVDIRFRHGDIDLVVSNAGIQCRGNTSREHQPRSFTVAFNAFVPGQRLLDLERFNLNANANDPSMARPKLIKDLAEDAGILTPFGNHVALVVFGPNYHRGNWVGGAFFDAVRNNTQPVDDVLLEQRFGTARGNLYKCLYAAGGDPATLEYRGADGSAYMTPSYNLKYAGSGDTSFDDLADFVALINQTADTNFPNAIMEAFDVDGFLQRMALDVLAGHWDNYWVNANNFYLFRHPDTRRWSFIPYDFDNTFGIRWIDADWGNQNIYTWNDIGGGNPSSPLMARIMAVPAFSNRYSFYLKEILDTSYSNAVIDPDVFHARSTLTNGLLFAEGVIPNM